jgi:hypothetical protein
MHHSCIKAPDTRWLVTPSPMRGFPLLRSLILLLVLVAGGLGLVWFTREGKTVSQHVRTGPTSISSTGTVPSREILSANYELVCSGPVKRVEILSLDAGDQPLEGGTATPELVDLRGSGTLSLSSPARILLKIEWQEGGTGPRFARLRLEPPGQRTRQHYFESQGDLEDLWEVEP